MDGGESELVMIPPSADSPQASLDCQINLMPAFGLGASLSCSGAAGTLCGNELHSAAHL